MTDTDHKPWCDTRYLIQGKDIRGLEAVINRVYESMVILAARRGDRNLELSEDLFREVYIELNLTLRHSAAIRVYNAVVARMCPHLIDFPYSRIGAADGHSRAKRGEIEAWIRHSVKGYWATGTVEAPVVFQDKASAALFKLFWCH